MCKLTVIQNKCVVVKSCQAEIVNIIINDHCFLPPLASLFITFIIDTSQKIVIFYRQTLWPQSFTSLVMRYELNLELDKSRDKPDKKQVILSVKGALHSKYK